MSTVRQPDEIEPPEGFDPDAEFVNLSRDRYTKVPTSSHRDGENRLEGLLALGVLTYYLSHKTGWKIESAEVLARRWKEGAGRIRDAVKDIERAGFLVRFRLQGKDGKWRTRTFVSSDPEQLAAARAYAAQLAEQEAARVATAPSTDEPTEPDSDAGAFSQVAPDVDYRMSVDRSSVDRASVDRVSVSGDLKNLEDQEEDQEKKTSSSPAASVAAPPAPRLAGSEEEDSRTSELVSNIQGVRVDWTADAIRRTIAVLQGQGRPWDLIAVGFTLAAADHTTHLPKRLEAAAWPGWRKAADLVRPTAPVTAMRAAQGCSRCANTGWVDADSDLPKRCTHGAGSRAVA